MKLGRVEGKVWASVKDRKLSGVPLYILQPVDEFDEALGLPIVAVDTVNSRLGDMVYWVGGAEATFAYDDRQIPSDATIVALVDQLNRSGD
jgi:ethanolamine utilization protein EutN